MHGRIFNRTRALAALLLAAAAAVAHASPGNGIRLGGSEGRLHPFFDLETRYDSNVSYTSANTAIADVILHFRPGAELKIPGDRAAVEFTGTLDWAQYLGVEGDTAGLSKLYADAGFAALFNRRSAVSLRLDNDFRRQVSTTSLTAATTAVVSNSNVLSASVPWKPGGGALVVTSNVQWVAETFQKYKDDPGVPLDELGYSQFRGGADVRWHFLPRTSAMFQAGYFARAPNASNRPDDARGFDLLTGLTGLLTPRIAATAKVGYGSTSGPTLALTNTANGIVVTTSDGTKDTGSVLADVGLEWLPMEAISFRTGYIRSLGLDPTASVFVADGVYAGVRVKVAERFAFRGGVRYDRLEFEAIPGGADTQFLRVDPTLEGSVGKWLTVGLGYVFSSRAASWPSTTLPDYSKNEAFLKLGLTY
jgi:hypothetical protein